MKKIFLLSLIMLNAYFIEAQTAEKKMAMELVVKNLTAIGLSDKDLTNFMVSDSYFDKVARTHMVYLQQTFKNTPVYNELLVLAFKNDVLVSKAGGRIASIEKKVDSKTGVPLIQAELAVQAALSDRKLIPEHSPSIINMTENDRKFSFGNLGVSKENITAQLTWVPILEGRKVVLAWQVYVIPVNTSDYWMIRVNASNNSIIGMDNYTSYCNWDAPVKKDFYSYENEDNSLTYNSFFENVFNYNSYNFPTNETSLNSPSLINTGTYRVIPFPAESPLHPGGTNTLITNPWTAAPGNASSLKWNSDGTTDYTITRGNNVWAQEDRNNNNGTGYAPTATSLPDPLVFDFTPSFTVAPTQTTPVPNQQFNITNLFYWNNIIHDITYQYGFDEVSGNFQANNQGRGGLGNDYVFADAQDGGGTNNANFSTPPDGSNGRMQMYLWSGNPQKDGDADNGVMVHEYGHGISTRLTGGPANSGCLSNAEQMGEGWSDWYALMYTQNWATSNLNTGFNSPRGIGTYVIGQNPNGSGIRSKKYCTNFAVNNLVYATVIDPEPHNRGELWCATLWDMAWNVINQVGTINPNIYNPAGGGGNTIAIQLVTEGLKLQACSPGFIDGRDGILQADQILYNGAYDCAIREAFRRRGMGAFASEGSSGSTSDQIPDFTLGGADLLLSQNGMTEVPEGGTIVYNNTVTASTCAPLTNFLLTDTLPSNVTYVSGGTYNSANRVVSFPVNLTAGQTQVYTFSVTVNAGAYFPTVTLFEDNVSGTTIPSTWTETSTTANHWVVSNARSHTAPSSYFSGELDVTSDERLFSTNAIALGGTPPPLSFWHWYNTESTYDGGVVEISTNGGTSWTDLGPNIISNGYSGTMDGTTLLAGRQAFTGSSNNRFIKTKIDLTPYANQSVKIRFRFTSDEGTNVEGWYVDDIAVKSQAVVEMRSSLFTAAGVRVQTSDTVTIILPPVTCTNVAVTTQPANTNACTGGNADFNITIDGTTPTYQWQVSTNGGGTWTDLAGETNATLSLTAITSSMNNNKYRVIVSNACPSTITSDAVTLTVSDPATISTQPVSSAVCEGTNTSFTIVTAGSGVTYQWQVSTDGGVTFTDIPGATGATLNLPAVTGSMNNNQYHVEVFSCSPTGLNSNNVTLTVNSLAAVTTQPSNTTACVGNDATITVTAAGTNNSYQWQVSTDGGITFTDIAGATTATLTLTGVTTALNNNIYHVIITNACTPAGVTSANATLTVSNTATLTTQPVNTTACEGANAVFTATASGASYQWQVSTDGGITFIDISGATTTTLTLTSVTAAMNNNQYQLVVGSCGSTTITSDHVTLTVTSLATITAQPLNTAVCDGADATFSVTAAGGAPVTYQWSVSTDGGATYTPIAGATTNTLTITGVTAAQNNNLYQVTVSNSCTPGLASGAATLTVNPASSITTQPVSTSACEGSSASFSATVSNASGANYQWQVSTDGGVTFTNIPGATDATLVLPAVTAAMNNNSYQLLVNICGTLTSSAVVLTVNSLPVVVITASPYVSLTSDLTTTLTATSTPASSTFSWYKNDVQIAGVTGNTIQVSHDQLGAYRATATDANGCTNSSNTLTIADSLVNIAFIYPNPNSGMFHVRYKGIGFNGQPRIISMYDAKGARVFSQNYVVVTSYQVMDVDASRFSKGVYMLVLSDVAGNTLGTGKVVIR